MALEFKLALDGDVLEIHESIHSAMDTRHSWFYYNIKTWLVSSFGKQGDVPDRLATPGAIEWVKRHYLPKVGILA